MAVLGRRLASSSSGGRIASAACGLLAWLHAGVAGAIRLAGRALGMVLSVLPWPLRLSALAGGLGAVALLLGLRGEAWLVRLAELNDAQVKALADAGVLGYFRAWCHVSGCLGWGMLGVALLALAPRKASLLVLRIAAGAFAGVWLWMLVLVVRAPAVLYETPAAQFSKAWRDELWVGGAWAWVAVALPAGLLGLCVMLGAVKRRYCGPPGRTGPEETVGDRVLADLAARGRDPEFRSSTYWSTVGHLAVFFVPFLLRSCGMEEPYGIPKGSGVQVVQTIKIKRVKPKKRQRLVLSMSSPIIFHVPKIDESDLLKELAEDTADEYEAAADHRKPGKGGGKTGGWPNGMENARVRFIRLKYRGGDWNQDMDLEPDYNLLLKFRELTGFQIAPSAEAIEIHRLRRFPPHRGPPFVYITGSGHIDLSAEEIRTLRWYCLEDGGMLFADNGGGGFDRAFRSHLRQVFPDLPLVDIANDDVIYRQPFTFPGGAPPLWHHKGYRAMGIKHEGRWVVFYHPGDIGDAWKTGHSGAGKTVALRAYKLGMNVMCYAFTEYLARHFGP